MSTISETPSLDIRKPIKEILIDLRKYHFEQLEYIDNLLNNKSENTPISDKARLNKNELYGNDKTKDELLKFTKIWFWEKNTMKFINQFFPKEKFTTRELVIEVIGRGDFEKEFINKVVYASSLSLGKLKKKGEIKAEKEDGLRGFKYFK